jgi:formate-dependent nitrite reductase membrane component NrfD
MLRVFKPRSPMSMGAWCLSLFGGLATASVGADLIGRKREARALGGANAVVGGYLGSYAGVLLASTAVPLWARSKMFLGPIFVTTAVANGAAATRLVLVAAGLPEGHRTRHALGRVETAAMSIELGMSTWNERRLGETGDALERGRAGKLFRFAKWSVLAGLALRALRPRLGRRGHDVASVLYLAGGLAFRYAWVAAGHNSATDDKAVARMARQDGGGT